MLQARAEQETERANAAEAQAAALNQAAQAHASELREKQRELDQARGDLSDAQVTSLPCHWTDQSNHGLSTPDACV